VNIIQVPVYMPMIQFTGRIVITGRLMNVYMFLVLPLLVAMRMVMGMVMGLLVVFQQHHINTGTGDSMTNIPAYLKLIAG
jgi:hypothetical protein